MFHLVVLSALVAISAAAPGHLHVLPVATSHQQRVDIIESAPVITKFVAPAVHTLISEDLSVGDLGSHIYDEDDHDDIHILAPEIKTINHQELHQVHDTPIVHEEIPLTPIVHSEEVIPLVGSLESHHAVHQVHDIDFDLDDDLHAVPLEVVHKVHGW